MKWIPEVDTTFLVTIDLYPDDHEVLGDRNYLIATRTEKVIVPALSIEEEDESETPEDWALSFLLAVMREELDEYEAVAFGNVSDYSEYDWMVDNKAPTLPFD